MSVPPRFRDDDDGDDEPTGVAIETEILPDLTIVYDRQMQHGWIETTQEPADPEEMR
jgi:hypothetical protein